MELWIRSQDKTRLMKLDYLQIIYAKEDKELPYYINASFEHLGAYKTKERALEVLDEIQRLIEDLQYMSYAIPNDKFTGYRPNVYQMPEE